MLKKRQISRARRRRSSGHVVIESALTMMPTFAMIFFFFDLGLALYRWSSLQNAVRAGARYAITMQTDSATGTVRTNQVAAIKARVASNSMGFVHTGDSNLFVRFCPQSNPDVCSTTSGNSPNAIVEVSVENVSYHRLMPLSGLYARNPYYASNDLSISVFSSDILGGYPVGVTNVTP